MAVSCAMSESMTKSKGLHKIAHLAKAFACATNYGQVISAGSARVLELGAKVTF